MQEEARLAYQFAIDLAKQLITLSTVILTLTIAFTKDIFKQPPSILLRITLILSWICYLTSIWYGVQHIQALTGSLEWTSIERAAVAQDSAQIVDRSNARQYLAASALADTVRGRDTLIQKHRAKLAATGILIGNSAKEEAAKQITWFFRGTALAVLYGVFLLIQRKKSRTRLLL